MPRLSDYMEVLAAQLKHTAEGLTNAMVHHQTTDSACKSIVVAAISAL